MAWFVIRVGGANAAGRTDINRISETVLIPLFAEVYNYRNLKNLNRERTNFPAIDLGDDDAKVAFQITAGADIAKIRDTLRKFEDNRLHQRFSKLYIYDLVTKQKKFHKNLRKTVEQDGFYFDRSKSVLDYRDVIKETEGLPIDRVFKIQSILESYFGDGRTSFPQFSDPLVPTELIDQNIKNEVNRLRKSRFFPEFDGIRSALVLTEKLTEGDFRGGTASVRSWALAWCARTLAGRGELDKAKEYLELAGKLGSNTKVAEALIISEMGNKARARNLLAGDDSSDSLSASFKIIAKHEGQQEAVSWLKDLGFGVDHLNSEGKFSLLRFQLELSQWESALETANSLCESDLEEVPVLHHLIALSHLLSTVPTDFRHLVLNQVPLGAANYPLASGSDAIEARRVARHHFNCGARTAQELGCIMKASSLNKYALWLELLDPVYSSRAKKHIEGKLRGPNPAPYLITLGLQFELRLNLVAVEKEIDRYVNFHGEGTPDVAEARLVLASFQETPEDAAKYVYRHRRTLSEFFDTQELRSLQIEMFANAGLTEKAKEMLEILSKEGLHELDKNRLLTVIDRAEGKDTVAERERLFKQTNSQPDLEALVSELERMERWDALCKYGADLFKKTDSVRDAERLANAMLNAKRSDQVVAMIDSNSDFLAYSTALQTLYCWALYFEGEFLKACCELDRLVVEGENDSHRALRVNIAVAMGDWNSLTTYVTDEFRERENRSAHELMDTARLAFQLQSPFAEQLISAAVSKASDDPAILGSAFLLASEAGFEDDPKYSRWLVKAAELSGDDGPLVRMTPNELVDLKLEWERQDSETFKRLNRGEIPMFLAAHSINRSLTDLMLFPAWANGSENDIRYRIGVPAYSGKNQVKLLKLGETIGFDATALLTLSFLELLDKALDACDTVYIPHSTLTWLFSEKRKATFRQPSRIRDAEQLSYLLTKDVLKQFSPSVTADRELAAQIGEELATFIGEAQSSTVDDSQHIFVRRSTKGHDSSLLAEEVDLTEYATVLSSCQAVVEKLHQMGKITTKVKQQALAHLQLHEPAWSFQQEISERATLYLDDSAVIFFLHLGLLETIQAAGFKLVVSPNLVAEVRILISHKGISSRVNDAIEHIRTAVNRGIETGKIKAGRISNSDGWKERSISEHPTVGLLEMATNCDAVIADDRFLNQRPHVEHNDVCTPLFSTLDLLDALVIADFITVDDLLEYKTKLRHAGYFFVPIGDEELTYQLNSATATNYKLNESAELGAIRENILSVKMSDWLQLPEEVAWPAKTEKALVSTFQALWRREVELSNVIARSNWIIDQLDIENGDKVLKAGRGGLILVLLVPPANAPQKIWDAYRKWAEEKILTPFKELYPDLFTWIVAHYKTRISEFANQEQIEGLDAAEIPNLRALSAKAMLDLAPPLIQNSLLEDTLFWDEFGIKLAPFLTFEDSGVSIQRSELYDVIRQVLSGESNLTVTDIDGREWRLANSGEESHFPILAISHGRQQIQLRDYAVLSPDTATRLRFLDRAASDVNLPQSARKAWHNVLCERALDDEEFDEFYNDLSDTPIHTARSIRSEIKKETISVSTLVPRSRRYYDRLVGVYDESGSVREYAAGSGRKFIQQLSEWRLYDGFLFGLLLSSDRTLTAEINVDHLERDELVQALDFLEKSGDRLSQLGAIEVGIRIFPELPEIQSNLIRLIEQIRDDEIDGSDSEFKLLSTMFFFVDGELSRARFLSAQPPFYRRLASIAQAALICRQYVELGVETDPSCEWVNEQRGRDYLQFYFQSLVDMRLEPRWCPEFALPSQMKANFHGRIIDAAMNYKENIQDTELHDLILGNRPDSPRLLFEFPGAFLPGLLEGGEDMPYPVPDIFLEKIETQLRAEKVEPSSFVGLVNFASILPTESTLSDSVVSALRRGDSLLAKIEEKPQLLTLLNGLASVAAVTRSRALADELRIFVRKHSRETQQALLAGEVLRICVAAAASRADLEEWIRFVGDCITELAFGKLESNERDVLHMHLQYLCHAVPELWASCSRADAALRALKGY